MAGEKMDRIMVCIDPELSRQFKHKLVDTEMSMADAIRMLIASFCSNFSNDTKDFFCEDFRNDTKKQEGANE